MEEYPWYEMEKASLTVYVLWCREHIHHALRLGRDEFLPWSSLWLFLHGVKKRRSRGTAPTRSLRPSARNSLLSHPKLASRTRRPPSQVHPEECSQVYTPLSLRGRVCEECGLVMQTGECTCMHTRALLAKVNLEVNADRPKGLGEEQANLVNSYLFRHFKICQGWPPFVLLLQARQCWVVQNVCVPCNWVILKDGCLLIIKAVFTHPCTHPSTGLANQMKAYWLEGSLHTPP